MYIEYEYTYPYTLNLSQTPQQQPSYSFKLKKSRRLAGSLQMASLAVRHIDTELAEATRNAYEQARDLPGYGRAPLKGI